MNQLTIKVRMGVLVVFEGPPREESACFVPIKDLPFSRDWALLGQRQSVCIRVCGQDDCAACRVGSLDSQILSNRAGFIITATKLKDWQ